MQQRANALFSTAQVHQPFNIYMHSDTPCDISRSLLWIGRPSADKANAAPDWKLRTLLPSPAHRFCALIDRHRGYIQNECIRGGGGLTKALNPSTVSLAYCLLNWCAWQHTRISAPELLVETSRPWWRWGVTKLSLKRAIRSYKQLGALLLRGQTQQTQI